MTKKVESRRFSAQRTWGDVPWSYSAICREIRRHLKRRGWPLWKLDDTAGWQDGYAGKALNPASPTGRVAGYDLIDLAFEALAGRGYRLLLVPADFDAADPTAIRTMLDEQDQAEAERIATLIDLAAHTNRIPKIATA
ncbi:hypothetical protein ACIU1J_05475 [Azospirillum doebereinerae]|uniref:hypothetical protein n=1 Tax=Azospirillum doebereinerae TaxID=92933 RepID=UPI001EE5EA5C|nr:hypothetical protein [Azospirillum doebereinerae]MCG5240866.1 hypothetical protein [Azospirillum doebereinerae]